MMLGWKYTLFQPYSWRQDLFVWSNYSDLTRPGPPKGSVLEGKSPAISGKSRLVKYCNLAIYGIFHLPIFKIQINPMLVNIYHTRRVWELLICQYCIIWPE